MPTTQDDLILIRTLTTLAAGELSAEMALSQAPTSETLSPATGLGRLALLALGGRFTELQKEAQAWRGPPLGVAQGLLAVALASGEPTEEALRLGLEAAWLPARPLPEPGDEAGATVWRLWEEHLATRLLGNLEPEPPGAGPTADPFFSTLLSVVDPLPSRAARRLQMAVESGLDLEPVRLALARLLRRAGDRHRARTLLTELATLTLEAPWTLRVEAELEACARDEELEGALRVEMEQRGVVRTLSVERGLFLAVEEEPHRWLRQVEPEDAATCLRALVDDHLDAGWVLRSWIPARDEDNLDEAFDEAMGQGAFGEALVLGRRLMQRRPDDALLASRVLRASVRLRGPAASIELSQRVLVLSSEPAWALRQHAALLFRMGAVEECLGTLFYLQDVHGLSAYSPASFSIAAACHLVPRYRPGVARAFLEAGLSRFPGHPALLEMQALLELFDGEHEAALEALAPLLEAPRPAASVFALGLQCLLEGELEGAEAMARRALTHHPGDPLLVGLTQEIAGAAKKAMEALRVAMAEAPTPMAALENQLYTLRAAYRLSAFEEGLHLARKTQTLLGEPDPRCLEVIYQCLKALEPGENREDLAEVAEEARRRAAERTLTQEDRIRAMLNAGFHLDPSLLEAPFRAWVPEKESASLSAASPEPTCALLPLATGIGFVTLFDVTNLPVVPAAPSKDWLQNPTILLSEQATGRLVLAPVPGEVAPRWLRVTTEEPQPKRRYRLTQDALLEIPSGRVFAGPGEALLGDAAALVGKKADERQGTESTAGTGDTQTHPGSLALAMELGGRFRLLTPGRYRVKVWHRSHEPWPAEEIEGDPADVVFQISAP